MRVSENASRLFAVHTPCGLIRACSLTLTRQLLVAVIAVPASNLKARHHSVSYLESSGVVFRIFTNLLYHAAELVAEDIAGLALNDRAVQEVQIATADGSASNPNDDISFVAIEQDWFGGFDDLDVVLRVPNQSLHCFRGMSMSLAVLVEVAHVLCYSCTAGLGAHIRVG